jgi:hypothetical protein
MFENMRLGMVLHCLGLQHVVQVRCRHGGLQPDQRCGHLLVTVPCRTP